MKTIQMSEQGSPRALYLVTLPDPGTWSGPDPLETGATTGKLVLKP
jgi:hypothetical protein